MIITSGISFCRVQSEQLVYTTLGPEACPPMGLLWVSLVTLLMLAVCVCVAGCVWVERSVWRGVK